MKTVIQDPQTTKSNYTPERSLVASTDEVHITNYAQAQIDSKYSAERNLVRGTDGFQFNDVSGLRFHWEFGIVDQYSIVDSGYVESLIDRAQLIEMTNELDLQRPLQFDNVFTLAVSAPTFFQTTYNESTRIPSTSTFGTVIMAGLFIPTGDDQWLFSVSNNLSDSIHMGLKVRQMNLNDYRLVFQQQNNDTPDSIRGNTNIFDFAAQMMIVEIQSLETSYQMRVNGVLQSLVVETGQSIGDWFGDISEPNRFTVNGSNQFFLFQGGLIQVPPVFLIYDNVIHDAERSDIYEKIESIIGVAV